MELMGNAYKILVGKSEGKRPLEKTAHVWEENMKVYVREIK
jgi:hypothetical protein